MFFCGRFGGFTGESAPLCNIAITGTPHKADLPTSEETPPFDDMSQGSSRTALGEKGDIEGTRGNPSEIDLTRYHEQRVGRLVLDPECVYCFYFLVGLTNHSCNREARIEFGDKVASRLKLSPDGKIVLWPQPSDDPEDPQNVRLCLESITDYSDVDLITFQWSEWQKAIQLIIITLAAVVPDFDSGIG